MRIAAKRDDTEPAIVKALELSGWTVIRLSDRGAPDLLAIRRGRLVPIECKSPGGTLTPAQRTAFLRWEAAGLAVRVVTTPAEALLAVAQGVEGLLGGLTVLPDPTDKPTLKARNGPKPEWLSEIEAETDRLMSPSPRHLVTPAYQRAQTEAVVPKRRKK